MLLLSRTSTGEQMRDERDPITMVQRSKAAERVPFCEAASSEARAGMSAIRRRSEQTGTKRDLWTLRRGRRGRSTRKQPAGRIAAAVVVLSALLCRGARGQESWTVRLASVAAHEIFLASDALHGRGSATRDEEIAAMYVASEFARYGLKPAPGVSTFVQGVWVRDRKGNELHTVNAMGYLPGTELGSGVLLLTAHLDHLGIVGKPMPPPKLDTAEKRVAQDNIYNGANDDASGTTAVLELAEALAAGPKLRRGVLFVCYGSEELGGLGSRAFAEHPPVPLEDLVANLEFEMVGNQDPKMPKGTLLLTGWERSNLGPELKAHGALLGPDPYPEQHFFERSDNFQLALKGVVAHTAAGWGTPPTYHQPNDDLQHLDFGFLTAAIQSLVEPVRWLANSDFVPKWTAGGRPAPRSH